MSRLYLLRHGLAGSPENDPIADDLRPLTPRGERRIRQVARGMKKLGVKLDKIITSPLPRAARTAEIVADVLDRAFLVEQDDVLRPNSDPKAIRDWLTSRIEQRMLLVGHNPNLSELLTLLTTDRPRPVLVELRKGGFAALRKEPEGLYRIDWLARPKLIRRMSE